MKPLINWEVLLERQQPAQRAPRPDHNWDDSAAMYNLMAEMERSYTEAYLEHVDVSPDDTVLDIGCGPGRISCLMAKRAKQVTAIDAFPAMLGLCRSNADAQGCHNVDTRLLDWHDVHVDEQLEQHDIVIASRSVGMYDLYKLNAFAKKYAVVIAWANDDSIPHILNELFVGTRPSESLMPTMSRDRRFGYNIVWNQVYDMGANPNIRIVKDGFRKTFADDTSANAYLRQLRPFDDAYFPVFQRNLEPLLTRHADGQVTFCRETTTFVLWWQPVSSEALR